MIQEAKVARLVVFLCNYETWWWCVCDWMCDQYQGKGGRERANRLVCVRGCMLCARVFMVWVSMRCVDSGLSVWIITFPRDVSNVS
jgi:hypothetical protein